MYINQDIIEKKKRNSYRKFFTFFFITLDL